jgi:hypothetical protein
MIRTTSLVVAVVAGLIAAAAALHHDTRNVSSGSTADIGRDNRVPVYTKGNVLNRCLSDPVECGLVVW